ncbi:hypothetical protein CL653_01640 [bacterium]|nr:hypothetical protein [bacterium]|tara:strand:+ start:99 stop:719 length:621 start_codon:yes stop_codon:yes gene_type:complete
MKVSMQTKQRGFSLIELLIALTLFSGVITMVTGVVLTMVDANAKSQNIQLLTNNLTFALDSLSREIRTGFYYYCYSSQTNTPDETGTRDCANGGKFMSVMEAGESLTAGYSSNRIDYYYDDNYYTDADGNEYGAILRRFDNGEGWIPLTSENVKITNMEFIVTGSSRADEVQPAVTIYLEGTMGDFEDVQSEFSLQTTIIQRIIDV